MENRNRKQNQNSRPRTQKRTTTSTYDSSSNRGDRNKPRARTKTKRVHKCALCHKSLENESYSNHYCQTDIEIQATSYLKKLLRKESEPRQNFPQVQHVWADPHPEPEKKNTYLLKIKAPLDIIPEFIKELQSHLAARPSSYQHSNIQSSSRPSSPHDGGKSNRSSPRPHSPFDRPMSRDSCRTRSPRSPLQPSQLLCSFFNSPDGCTNQNCQRIHREDPKERQRLLELKQTIQNSKVLNEPIKGLFAILEDAIDKNQELFEAIDKNFKLYLRQPTEKPIFQENVEYVQQAFEFGQELTELRDELKALSRRCYTNSNPYLQQELHELIEYTKKKVEEMKKLDITEEKIYQKSKQIYDTQFLSRCIMVI